MPTKKKTAAVTMPKYSKPAKDNRLDAYMKRHGISAPALLDAIAESGLVISQSALANYTCAGGGGLNVPNKDNAVAIVRALQMWGGKPKIFELFPSLRVTGEERKALESLK